MHNLGGDTETYRGVGTQKPTEGGGDKEKHRGGVAETHRGDTEPHRGGSTETHKCDGHTDRHMRTHRERCTYRGGAHPDMQKVQKCPGS